MPVTRRSFLTGCSAAIAAMAGGRLTNLGFATAAEAATNEILVTIFLRGGIDGLSLVAPYTDSNYNDLRPNLKLPQPGTGANAVLDLNGQFGLHPQAAPLRELYQQQSLAVVHACGLTSDTRSHFDAMDFMERGTPNVKNGTTGWLTRHMTSGGVTGQIPAVAAGSLAPASLLSSTTAVAMNTPGDFSFDGHWRWKDGQRLALRHMYNGDTWLHDAGVQALNATDVVELLNPSTYVPAPGASYPDHSFGEALMTLAQMIKLDVGLRVATADFGGWDTHEYQGDGGTGYFASQVGALAQGLKAFYTDLQSYSSRLTIVVISEFGRRLRENGNRGTDHGHGNVMMVLGGNVNGGQVFASPWPGLGPGELDQGTDLAITTDYRRILSEILIRRCGNPNLGIVFPGYGGYSPLGVVRGGDVPPNYGTATIANIQTVAGCFDQSDPACLPYDYNNNGVVDLQDVQSLAAEWSKPAP